MKNKIIVNFTIISVPVSPGGMVDAMSREMFSVGRVVLGEVFLGTGDHVSAKTRFWSQSNFPDFGGPNFGRLVLRAKKIFLIGVCFKS